MRDVIALVLAGGKVGDYGVLTLNRPKGALTFAGSYRIIDYALSSLRQAGIEPPVTEPYRLLPYCLACPLFQRD